MFLATDRTTIDTTLAETEIVEEHFHNVEYWFGSDVTYDGAVSPTSAGSRASMIPYTITSGNDDYGDWVPLLGSTDTPIKTGYTQYDAHRISLVGVETRQVTHRLQFVCGDTASDADACVVISDVSELIITPYDIKAQDRISHLIDTRSTAGDPFWCRSWVAGMNGDNLQLFLGIHEYEE